ncbi:MAG: LptF/LptG family permease [Bacteroidales bacterium]|jgi:lipopolysaccharide export system permease protein|nr:LptF/LptG family permease [Bacteroidales bacterium]
MKILHRFMLKQFIGPFVLIFFIVVFILLMQFLWKYIDELVGKGLNLFIIGEFLLYASAGLASMAFPLAVLMASIFTLSSLGENYELIAMKAAGISLQRVFLPLIVMACLISAGAFLFVNNVTPVTNLKMRALLEGIRHQRPELQIREGVFSNMIDGYSIRIGRKDYETNRLYDVRIYDHTENIGNVSVILADSGNMMVTADKRFLEITLYNGHRYREMVDRQTINKKNKTYPFSHQLFERQIFRMALPDFNFERSDEQIFKKGYQMMNLDQLTYVIDSLSTVSRNQESMLRTMIKPAYQSPHGDSRRIDTTLRTRIPEVFMPVFRQQSKAKRQASIQNAITDTRSQKDRFSGVIYEREILNRQAWRYDIEWYRKFSLSLACIILFFIGAPLGAIIRKSGLGTSIIIAVLFFVVYYVISMIGEKAAKSGSMTPLWGMWLSAIIVLPVSIFLTYKATRDSTIFNQEWYLNLIRKGLNVIFATLHTPRPAVDMDTTPDELRTETLIARLDELSQQCEIYSKSGMTRMLRLGGIWYDREDTALTEIGRTYDHVRALLRQTPVEAIEETVAEYPHAILRDCRIQVKHQWQRVAAKILFPVLWYLYVKVMMQRMTLRNELDGIMGANRNLINELTVDN